MHANNSTSFGFFVHRLYVVGTMGFSELAFERTRDAYDLKVRARQLLADCLLYAQFYSREMSSSVWQKYRRDQYIDVSHFTKLLEQAGIILSDSEIAALIKEM